MFVCIPGAGHSWQGANNLFLNPHIESLIPYKTTSHKAWDDAHGTGVLKLDWNESTIAPSNLVRKRLARFAEDARLHWYPDVDNTPLRQKIAGYADVLPTQVEYFSGSDGAHECLIRTFVGLGDVVASVSPSYDNFRASAEAVGAKVSYFFLQQFNNFVFDLSAFRLHLTSCSPRLAYLCNPNNPTGFLLTKEAIESLLVEFPRVLFVVDEAYYEFSGVTVVGLCEQYSNLIVTRTFSKAFGLASFRIGYVVACESRISEMQKLRNPKSVSAPAQLAALAALEDVQYTRRYVAEVIKARFWTAEQLRLSGIPVAGQQNGNFILLNAGAEAAAITNELEQHAIYIRDMSFYPALAGFLRLTVGTVTQMQKVIYLMCKQDRQSLTASNE